MGRRERGRRHAAYVAIGRSMPDRLRPQMFALLATAWVIPGVIGPVVAATVATQLHWRIVFIGLLPIIVTAGALTLVPLLRVPARSGQEASKFTLCGGRAARAFLSRALPRQPGNRG